MSVQRAWPAFCWQRGSSLLLGVGMHQLEIKFFEHHGVRSFVSLAWEHMWRAPTTAGSTDAACRFGFAMASDLGSATTTDCRHTAPHLNYRCTVLRSSSWLASHYTTTTAITGTGGYGCGSAQVIASEKPISLAGVGKFIGILLWDAARHRQSTAAVLAGDLQHLYAVLFRFTRCK